jgi:DNA-binding MarR family transcriptional regulator
VNREDRRAVFVALTSKGERVLERLASLHRNELLAIRRRFSFLDLHSLE